MILSKLSSSIPTSGIISLNNEVKKRKQNGEEILNFTIGDFDSAIFPIPALLKKEIINAYEEGFTTYPQSEGNMDLREAIAAYLRRSQSLNYEAEDILVASGGRPLIYAAYHAIVDAGDRVVYPVPSWNNNCYSTLVNARHAIVHTSSASNFMPSAKDIAPHLKGAVLLALCSPQNPTGTSFNREELSAICELVVRENNQRGKHEKKLYLLYDQMYGALTYADTIHYDPVSLCPEMRPYTIYIDAVSKVFAATGVRVGWSFGPEHVLDKMKAMLMHIGAWAPTPEQKGVARFLNNPIAVQDFIFKFKLSLESRLTTFYNGFMQLKNKGFPVDAIQPQAAIYLSLKLDIKNVDVVTFLLKEVGVALIPFSIFGTTPGLPWYRLSVGTCQLKDIQPLLLRLEKALAKHCQHKIKSPCLTIAS